jgi:hypothetical protein
MICERHDLRDEARASRHSRVERRRIGYVTIRHLVCAGADDLGTNRQVAGVNSCFRSNV